MNENKYKNRAVSCIKGYLAEHKDTIILKKYKDIAKDLNITITTLRTYLNCYEDYINNKNSKKGDKYEDKKI